MIVPACQNQKVTFCPSPHLSQGAAKMDNEVHELRMKLRSGFRVMDELRDLAFSRGSFRTDAGPDASAGDPGFKQRDWADSPEGIRWHESLQVCSISMSLDWHNVAHNTKLENPS